VIGVSHRQNRALCASAVTRRAWGAGLHHVLDARTGVSVRDVVATWVVADEAVTADGLATALFFTSADHLAKAFRFSYVRMFADRRVEISEDFDVALFTHPTADGISVGYGRPEARERAERVARKGEGATALSRRVRVATLTGFFVSLVMAPGGPTGMSVVRPTAASDAGATRAQSTISGRRRRHRGQRHAACDEPDVARVSAPLRRRGPGGRGREAHRRGERESSRRVQRDSGRVQRGHPANPGAGSGRPDSGEVTLSLDPEVAQQVRHILGCFDQQPHGGSGAGSRLRPRRSS
jgi:ApbE family